MGISVDVFETNGSPALSLSICSSRREEALTFVFRRVGQRSLSLLTSAATRIGLLARAIPDHGIPVFVRINLVEINLRLRRGLGPRRILFWPRRLVVHFRDRFSMV